MEAGYTKWTMTWLDSSGTKVVHRGTFKPGAGHSAMLAALADLAALMEAVSGCKVISGGVVYTLKELLPPFPSGSGSIRDELVFHVLTDDPDKTAIVRVPGVLRDVLLTDTPFAGVNADLTQADVAAFVSDLVEGAFCDPFGNDFTSCDVAFLSSDL